MRFPAAVVPDLLNHAARRFPSRVCVAVEDRSLTFSETTARAAAFAGYLEARGLAGRRVAVLAYNEPELIEIRAAVPRAESILVPLNYRLSIPELASTLEDCEPDLLVVGPGLEEIANELPISDTLVLGEQGSYATALAAAPSQPIPAALRADALGMINYTSGTTGRAKGVMLTNAALHATLVAMGHEMAARSDSIYMSSNPMFHVGAAVAYGFTYLGATCLQLRRFDSTRWLEHLHAGNFTHGQLVPTMVHDLLELSGDTAPRLERLMYGSAPMPPELAKRTYARWGCELVNGFGSTEAMGVSMLTPSDHDPDNAPHLLASVGQSSPGMVWRLADEDGHDVGVGEVGEVLARGSNLMSGYWRSTELTEEALQSGWMHMGDLAYRDADGYLYLVDRRGDKIVTGGENVYPSEIENVLIDHPTVAEAAVIGLPHARWGEEVTAVVVSRPGATVVPAELIAYCRERLAHYKSPKTVTIVGVLPRTATGKLRRSELRRTLTEREL
jgi:acyl-CoA synthetase (AMP-forming)/AMP-acid ligase II